MAKHTNLSSLFKDVADAIRSKTGKTDKIVADDFPEAIEGISTGHPNGTEWTKISDRNELNGLYYFSDKWFIEGYMYDLAYSTDLRNWTSVPYDFDMSKTQYGGLWLAVVHQTGQNKAVCYSEDGVTWHQSDLSGFVSGYFYNPHIEDVIGFQANTDTDQKTYYSMDGKHWIEEPSKTFQGSYNAGIYITIKQGGLQYSLDGLSWEQSNITSGAKSYIYGNGRWVADVLDSTGSYRLYYSTNGQTWEKSDVVSGFSSVLTYNKGIFHAVVDNSPGLLVLYSTDGISWHRVDLTRMLYTLYKLEYSGGVWTLYTQALSPSGEMEGPFQISYSYDGIAFTECLSLPVKYQHFALECVDSIMYLACGHEYMYCSRDRGVTWEETNLRATYDMYIYHNNNIWIALHYSTDGGLYYSYDGINWNRCIGMPDNNFNASYIYYLNNIWLCVKYTGSGKGLYYSVGWEPPSTN